MATSEAPVDTRVLDKRRRNGRMNAADQELRQKLSTVLADPTKTYDDILKYIGNEIKESTRVTGFSYRIKCFKEDGAYALSRAVETVHGFTTQADEKNMSGSNPPTMIDIRFHDGTRKKVPFGTINLPSLGKEAYIEMAYSVDTRELVLQGQCERRFVKLMDEIVEATKNLVETDSIYKGRAIKIKDEQSSPEFIDLSNIEKTHLFLTNAAQFATQPIEARIEYTERCRKNNIDLKFGVLLEGNYGTGKTLYAFKLALKAIRNNWSFVYCQTPEKALYVMEIANMLSKNGSGVVTFLEDIDKILNTRTNLTNQISVMMDGGETKNTNVITIFTTNHMEDIDPTFLRGKRIGSIVTLTYPDAGTAKKMIEAYMVNENDESILSEDITRAAQYMEENKIVPAFIAEILERVKSHMIYSEKAKVTNDDIINSVDSYKKQMEIATVRDKARSDAEVLYDILKLGDKGPKSDEISEGFKKAMRAAGFNIK